MNDDDLLTAVRESFDDVRSTTALERIVSRSRVVRARRRIPVATGVLALAAGAAVAVTTLLPASHQPGHAAHAQLAAWTVSESTDGSIHVRIREFRDPGGLQRQLRADGIPASVFLLQRPPPGGNRPPGDPCHGGPWSQARQDRVVTGQPFSKAGMVIHPSALPRHAGLQLLATRKPGYWSAHHNGAVFAAYWLVRQSPRCTGN